MSALVLSVVVAISVGIVANTDTGVQEFRAHMTDSGSTRVGDDVRISGVSVGEIRSVDLKRDHVEITFSVQDSVFVGDQTSIEVRMLTIVGGHFLALSPAGTEPLGSQPIGADRVILPYSLPEVFADAVEPVEEIDGRILRENLGTLGSVLEQNPSAIGSSLDMFESLVRILDRQNADVSKALSLSDEYLGAINMNKDVLGRLTHSFNILETITENHILQINNALSLTSDTMARLAPVGRAWQATVGPGVEPLAKGIATLEQLRGQLGTLIDSLHDFGSRLAQMVEVHGTTTERPSGGLPAPDLCVPVPGRIC